MAVCTGLPNILSRVETLKALLKAPDPRPSAPQLDSTKDCFCGATAVKLSIDR